MRFALSLLLFCLLGSLGAAEKKSVCLNMIVKNESNVIERCLKSVRPLIDYWVIVDTGSSDGTQEIIKNYLKDIPGELHERPWVNFGHNRDEALLLARGKGDYVFFIDADEQIVISDTFTKEQLQADAYHVICEQPGGQWHRLLFINNHLDWRWRGVLHEELECKDVKTLGVLEGLSNKISYDGARNQNPNKFLDDAKLLEAAVEKEPDNSRYVFYLAKSYDDAQDAKNALKNYLRRAPMGGFVEEVFWSLLRIGKLQQTLGMDAETVIASYKKAFDFRPTRIEALYFLAEFYLASQNYPEAYETCKKALFIPPHTDIGFAERWMYDYGLLFQFFTCAYHMEKFDEALKACHKLLKIKSLPEGLKEPLAQNIRIIDRMIHKPKICLNMIVKNESKIIERCLSSVKPLIDSWVIVDTGSTDGTQEIIKKCMKDIPGELHEREWVDFEHNRNEALNLAKGKGDYLFFIDADEELIFAPDFKKPILLDDAYYILCQQTGAQSHRLLLVSNDLDWKWKGILHEAILCDQVKSLAILPGILNQIHYDGARSQNPNKYKEDAKLLESAIKNEPNNSRYMFYLAKSYDDANMPEEALQYYQKRVDMGGFREEIFWSLVRIAKLQQALGEDSEVFIASYEKAFACHPCRIEPLYFLTEYYLLSKNYEMAYETAKRALAVPPHHDISMVEQWMYDYGLLFQFSDCAYHVGNLDEAIETCQQVLKIKHIPLFLREAISNNIKVMTLEQKQKEVEELFAS